MSSLLNALPEAARCNALPEAARCKSAGNVSQRVGPASDEDAEETSEEEAVQAVDAKASARRCARTIMLLIGEDASPIQRATSLAPPPNGPHVSPTGPGFRMRRPSQAPFSFRGAEADAVPPFPAFPSVASCVAARAASVRFYLGVAPAVTTTSPTGRTDASVSVEVCVRAL